MAWLIDQGPGHEAPSVPGNRQVYDRDHSHQAEGDCAAGSQTGQAVQQPIVVRCHWLAPGADPGRHQAPRKRYERSTGEVPLFSSVIQPEALGSNPQSGSRPAAVFGTAAAGHQANPPPTTIALAAAAGTGVTSARGGEPSAALDWPRRRWASRPGQGPSLPVALRPRRLPSATSAAPQSWLFITFPARRPGQAMPGYVMSSWCNPAYGLARLHLCAKGVMGGSRCGGVGGRRCRRRTAPPTG